MHQTREPDYLKFLHANKQFKEVNGRYDTK